MTHYICLPRNSAFASAVVRKSAYYVITYKLTAARALKRNGSYDSLLHFTKRRYSHHSEIYWSKITRSIKLNQIKSNQSINQSISQSVSQSRYIIVHSKTDR